VDAVFYGIKAAVLAIVIEALLRVARRALKSRADWVIAGLAFLALYCLAVPFPVVIIVAAVYGFVTRGSVAAETSGPLPPFSAVARTASVWLAIWLVPLAALAFTFGPDHVLTQIGVFFSKLAVVTFGGAYAVLSYMAQAAVESEGWLTAAEMIDGLALAETTPGPLILVTQFVGYLAALRETGSIWGGVAGALVTLWMTFAPCFLWIFVGAPYVDLIGRRPRLSGALAAITAAVVGVIFNLSVWFGLHVLFGTVARVDGFPWFRPWLPDWAGLDVGALGLSVIAAVLLLRFHLGVIQVLAICAALGVMLRFGGL
jgi:chromate transporter